MANKLLITDPDKLTNENLYDVSVAVGTRLWIDQVKKWKKELLALRSFSDFHTLSPILRNIREQYDKTFFLSYLVAHDNAQQEILKQLELDKDEKADDKWRSGYNAGIEFYKNKKILSAAEFKAARASTKATTFSVQRLDTLNGIIVTKNSILSAIEQGWDLKFWKEELNGLFDRMGITPLSNHHLQVVYRNNIQNTYNVGKRESYASNPAVVYQVFDAIVDSRTTKEICLPLDGLVAKKTDSIWGTITPQNHHACRSTIRGATESYYKKKKLDIDSEANKKKRKSKKDVDKDFKHSPSNLSQYNKQLQSRVKEQEKENQKIKIPK